MRKELVGLLVLLLMCVGGITGCGLLGEKEASTSGQQTNDEEEKKKEETSEQKNDAVKKKESESNVTEQSEKEDDKDSEKQGELSKEETKTESSKSSSKETQAAVSQVNWGSYWTRDINTDWADIEFTERKGNTLKFSINSMHTDNAEAARGGYINIGEIKGAAKVSGNVATQITDEIGSGCMVKLTNYQSYIQVEPITDCSGGGGLGVYFDGKYKKGDLPMPDWWKEEVSNSDNSTEEESKEEQDQSTEQEQATEDTEGATEEEPSEDTQTLISREQAIQRVKDYLNLSLENMHYIDEGDTATGKYLIRVYQYQEATADSTEHEAPYGYFIVNPKTGEVTDVNND
ncbi:PepSY domain-containing protein [Priestia aryabhattai]|uniref:PepSY domain-containing protein n=1 Tax=Priestia aryabhattai TaxID=412384 RepID=A0AAX6NBS5_PRIAR|nr:PepSY domain-containing protein [Priestia aryabhattai]MDU9693338.1 PepSY domain-containing protein [Priestia aryabhattai]